MKRCTSRSLPLHTIAFAMPRPPQQRRPAAVDDAAAAARPPPAGLPTYEPPMHPLDDKARALLHSANDPRVLRKINNHVAKSIELLTKSVGCVNDRLAERRKLVKSLEKRRLNSAAAADGARPLKAEMEPGQAAYLADLEAKVARLTELSEAAMRDVLDYRVELVDEEAAFAAVEREVARQQPRPVAPRPERKTKGDAGHEETSENEIGEEEEEDEEMADVDNAAAAASLEPHTSAVQLLRKELAARQSQYRQLSMHQRYSQDNDYIIFKKTWHDAVHDGDGVPVPHASTWFDKDGRPVAPNKDAVQEDGSDDELMIQREVVDLRCPLTQAIMEEPYTSCVCKHTFEKSAIYEYISQFPNSAKCPVCTQVCCPIVRSPGTTCLPSMYVIGYQEARSLARRGHAAEDQACCPARRRG